MRQILYINTNKNSFKNEKKTLFFICNLMIEIFNE